MIQALQKKFIITSMIAITALLLFLLGAINIANIVITGKQTVRTLHMISENEGDAANLPVSPKPDPDARPPEFSIKAPKDDYDTFLASNFFLVRFDQSGTIIYVDVSRTSAVTEKTASKLARSVYESAAQEGKTGKFRYLIADTRIRNGTSIVFLDTSAEILSCLRILLLSIAIGTVCWGMMLVFVVLLSKKAIRPVAENMEKQKQFITNAGHEIKTPLAVIQSNTEAMELYHGENKWSRNIKEQISRLNGLMQYLLFLARMEENSVSMKSASIPLSTLLSTMIQTFAQAMEQKSIFLQTDLQPELYLYADQHQIEQLLSILLDNAVKYVNQSGEIHISLQKMEKRIRLQIKNTCDKLPDVPPDRLFDRFYRADSARTQKSGDYSGYGIGLSAAQSITAANNGTIRAEYLQPDHICFTVQFSSAPVTKRHHKTI